MDHDFISLIKVPFVLALYFVPTLIARARMHPHIIGIVLTNLLVGWTGLGWIAAAIWACIKPKVDDASMARHEPVTPDFRDFKAGPLE